MRNKLKNFLNNMAQFKPKFEIGDRVIVVKKNNDNFGCIGTIYLYQIIRRYYPNTGKWKSKMRYTVSFEEKGVVMHYADFYAEDLKFADIHALAEHCSKELEKQEKELKKATKCKYCGEPFDEEFIESSEEPGACEYCVDQRKKMPKIHMRKSIAVDLKDFSIFGKDDDWLEVTEWTNGEGIDIDIHYSSDHEEDIRNFKLSYDELGVIMNIVNKFGYLPTIYTTKEKEN